MAYDIQFRTELGKPLGHLHQEQKHLTERETAQSYYAFSGTDLTARLSGARTHPGTGTRLSLCPCADGLGGTCMSEVSNVVFPWS